jgi:hypothetical protein
MLLSKTTSLLGDKKELASGSLTPRSTNPGEKQINRNYSIQEFLALGRQFSHQL